MLSFYQFVDSNKIIIIFKLKVLENTQKKIYVIIQSLFLQNFVPIHLYKYIFRFSQIIIDWQDLGDEFCGSVDSTRFGLFGRDVTVRLIKFSPAGRLALDFTEPGAP